LPAPAAVAAQRRDLFDSCENEVDEALIALRHGDANRHRLNASTLKDARLAATRLRGLLGCKRLDPFGDFEAPGATDELAKHILKRVPEAAYLLRAEPRASARLEAASHGAMVRSSCVYILGSRTTMSGATLKTCPSRVLCWTNSGSATIPATA